jgi:hypothetical protein
MASNSNFQIPWKSIMRFIFHCWIPIMDPSLKEESLNHLHQLKLIVNMSTKWTKLLIHKYQTIDYNTLALTRIWYEWMNMEIN